jgi:Tol biopolymer transport system component/predicted Ser/Thr protein kinase
VNADRWKQIEDCYHAALERRVPERAAFLAQACANDPELRREVQSLLAQEADSFLESAPLSAIKTLAPGAKLGNFEIVELIGRGGMGEVYRARDSRLKRDVAIKVLPAGLAQDPERLARFKREAKVLASLNHPHIAQIYDVEDAALIMELVDGDALKGPLSLEATLHYARQIADALEAAHEKGIVHRDLKPANIKITSDGVVKVLDFGLAAVAHGSVSDSDPTQLPTITMAETKVGTVLGTAAYMSPEQAAGKPVDKRADIWSYGVVLFEMLTGRRPFQGETLTETLASVVKDVPDLSKVPVRFRHLLESCLEKDPKKRLRDIGDAWRLLEDSSASVSMPSRKLIWATFAMAAIAAAGGVFEFLRLAPTAEPYRLAINPPPGAHFEFANDTGGLAISPDGRKVAFVAGGVLWLRPLDSETATMLPGTNGAYYPFWSPNLHSIGFFARDKLMRVDLPSGPVTELATLESGSARGGSWNANGTILYSEIVRSLFRVASNGGQPAHLTSLDESHRETAHYHPSFLPDGDRYLYMIRTADAANNGVYVGSLKDPKLKKRVATALSNAACVPPMGGHPGYLVFYREGALVAQAFDAKALRSTGEPEVLSESVGYLLNNNFANFSVSETGTVVLSTLGTPKAQMTWLDRRGNATTVASPPDYFSFARISPDGSRVVMQKGWAPTTSPWIFDFKRGVLSRMDEEGSRPAWSADGRQVIYYRGSERALVRKNLDSPQPGKTVARLEADLGTAFDWSPDEQFAVVESPRGLVAFALNDPTTSHPLTSRAKDYFPRFSPDGKWLAYHSRQSDKYEVFVQDFPEGRTRIQVSNQGGVIPLWRGDQKELFYLTPDGRIMAVDIRSGTSGLAFGIPHALFASHNLEGSNLGGADACDVTADGQRFLCLFHVENDPRDNQLTVLNWRAALRR